MGKRIIQRARGKGGPRYRAPSHRYVGRITYNFSSGEIIDIVHDPGRDAPLAKVKADTGKRFVIAAEGLRVGDKIDLKGKSYTGNILPLSKISKGTTIFAIETYPGSGPKLCCTTGTRATIISHDKEKVIIQLPSKEFKKLNPKCLVTVGIPAGSGRRDKPYVKAGQKFFATRARNKLWPRTSAVAMNPVDHPFGGQTKPGKSKSRSRHAPPGAKVGSIASKRTGKRKK